MKRAQALVTDLAPGCLSSCDKDFCAAVQNIRTRGVRGDTKKLLTKVSECLKFKMYFLKMNAMASVSQLNSREQKQKLF